MRALLPALLLALFGGWCGTFYYGASAPAVICGHLLLLGAAAWGWRGWDPLRLGPWGKVLAPLLWLWLVLAMRASPVSRAGWLAAALLPVFLALPAAVARCWATAEERRRGAFAIAMVAGGTGAVALAGAWLQGSPRAAQPLGNAVVLGEFLVTLAPLALLPALRERGTRRWVAVAALGLVLAAMLATRSVATAAAAVVGAAIALPRGKRRWLLVPLLAGALVLGPRLARIAADEDGSLQARQSYWRGAVRGLAVHPWLGWGPGASAWTLAAHIVPRPAANTPGEVPADPHSLPLQLAYELGLPGLALATALGVAFALARSRELGPADAVELRRTGLAGLAAGVTALAAGPTLATTAPWVALAIAAGAALAGSAAPAARAPRGMGWLYAAVALLLLAPLDAALACYGVARRSPPPQAGSWMALAVELDPQMPLYRARLGWLAPDATRRRLELARAATGAPGVAALPLAAGWAAQMLAGSGDPGGEPLLAVACNADPLAGTAPFLLAFAQPDSPRAPALAARAILADPALLAAVDFEARPELLAAALGEVARWDGVDAGLRKAILDVAARLPSPRQGAIGRRGIAMDDEATTAVSLIAFRRLPWPQTLGFVGVRLPEARILSKLSGAGWLRTTRPGAFPQPCVLPAPPGR
ncbi:MAG TPA: O-antigen ligase family protein [Thermoanaerobaculia bacterium]|nr:O-antigen ligase family protein [Thermoanaerobaculia bacterium]